MYRACSSMFSHHFFSTLPAAQNYGIHMTDNETCLPASSSSIMVEVPVDKCTADKLEKFHEEISIILSLSLFRSLRMLFLSLFHITFHY